MDTEMKQFHLYILDSDMKPLCSHILDTEIKPFYSHILDTEMKLFHSHILDSLAYKGSPARESGAFNFFISHHNMIHFCKKET
jgi:hypothetical protein